MRRLGIIFMRELRAAILSPTSWLLVTLVWLAYGALFRWSLIPETGSGDVLLINWQAAMQAMGFQLFIVPLQTMRLISEERRNGTFEMLVTTPVRDIEIVLGKFLSAWLFNAFIWIVIPLYAFVMSKSGAEPDFGPVWTSYLAVVATGALYLAIGMFASSLTMHQILAAFIAFVMVMAVGILPNFWNYLPSDWELTRSILRTGDLRDHTDQAARGLLDTVHLTYKFAFCALFLLFTTRVLEIRKWA